MSARDVRLGRSVALKLRVADADATMLEEARALALLDHPNVVRVYDVEVVSAVVDGVSFRLWIVAMQRIAGRNLRTWLREQKRPVDEILRVFLDAGRGLAAAHEKGIVHRDFKPDNVMVRDDGVVMVLDFGFAITAASTLRSVNAPYRGVAGTDPYMAPEACLGQPKRRSDQFSFGVSLVEALTGEAQAAGRCPPDIAPGLWSVLIRSTSERAVDRFEDMTILLAALEDARSKPPMNRRGRLVVGAVMLAAWTSVGAIVATSSHSIPVTLSKLLYDQRSDIDGSLPSLGLAGDAGRSARAGGEERDTPRGALLGATADSAAPSDVCEPVYVDAQSDLGDVGGDERAVSPIVDTGSVHCPSTVGTYRFRTVRRRGGRVGDATSAVYEIVLAENHRGLFASLARAWPMVDHLEIIRLQLEPDCVIRIRAAAESRQYYFRITIVGGAISGGFEATGDPARPDFSGDVESVRP